MWKEYYPKYESNGIWGVEIVKLIPPPGYTCLGYAAYPTKSYTKVDYSFPGTLTYARPNLLDLYRCFMFVLSFDTVLIVRLSIPLYLFHTSTGVCGRIWSALVKLLDNGQIGTLITKSTKNFETQLAFGMLNLILWILLVSL